MGWPTWGVILADPAVHLYEHMATVPLAGDEGVSGYYRRVRHVAVTPRGAAEHTLDQYPVSAACLFVSSQPRGRGATSTLITVIGLMWNSHTCVFTLLIADKFQP